MRRLSLVQRIFALAFFVWAVDFLTKNWALANLSSTPRKILGEFLQLTLLKNPGAAFSFATEFTIIFTAISTAVMIFILKFSPRITSPGWSYVAGLVLGGVLGNLSDRFFREPGFLYGHVIDWIELPNWPIFNVADSSITIAAVIAFTLTVKNISPVERGRANIGEDVNG